MTGEGTTGAALLLSVAIALAATPVAAQMYSPGYGTYGAPMSNFLASSYLVQQVANGSTLSARQGAGPARPAVKAASVATAPSAGAPIAPASLASAYPKDQRAAAAAYFQQVLDGYAKLERQAGVPPRDLGGAMAAFIVGNWMAYSGKPVPDAEFKALVEQMRGVLSATDALGRASPQDLQQMYEQFAILGTHMALVHTGLQQQPNPALADKTREAARQYLQQFLQVDPQKLSFGPQGVAAR